MTPADLCRAEIARDMAYIAAHGCDADESGPRRSERWGAMRGLEDWFAELMMLDAEGGA